MTSLIGIIGGICTVLYPIVISGRLPTGSEVVLAIVVTVGGMAAKAHNVTGGSVNQQGQTVNSDCTVQKADGK
jgi:hypothetical protein